MTNDKAKQEWQGRTGGGNFGQRALVWLLRITSLRFIYAMLVFVVPFYIVFANKRYMAIYRYFRRQHGYSPIKSFLKANRNHFVFGQVVVDRFAVFAGKKDTFDIEIENFDIFEQLSQSPKGFVIVSSHIGNYEITGYLLRSDNKKIKTLVSATETAVVSGKRMEMMRENNIYLISVTEDMSHIFAASAALQKGHILASVADRLHGSDKSVECSLLNGHANFPIGTFMLAASFEVEILVIFNIKIAPNRYKLFIRKLSPDIKPNSTKRQVAEAHLHAYVAEIESILKQYPEQWFNFYNFWRQDR